MAVTTCHACKHVSERPEPFSDLILQIKGMADLNDSLREYLKQEELTGSNQYRSGGGGGGGFGVLYGGYDVTPAVVDVVVFVVFVVAACCCLV